MIPVGSDDAVGKMYVDAMESANLCRHVKPRYSTIKNITKGIKLSLTNNKLC